MALRWDRYPAASQWPYPVTIPADAGVASQDVPSFNLRVSAHCAGVKGGN